MSFSPTQKQWVVLGGMVFCINALSLSRMHTSEVGVVDGAKLMVAQCFGQGGVSCRVCQIPDGKTVTPNLVYDSNGPRLP